MGALFNASPFARVCGTAWGSGGTNVGGAVLGSGAGYAEPFSRPIPWLDSPVGPCALGEGANGGFVAGVPILVELPVAVEDPALTVTLSNKAAIFDRTASAGPPLTENGSALCSWLLVLSLPLIADMPKPAFF